MTKEDKKRNKEHCKDMPWDIKLQCWFCRNREEIYVIIGTVISSSVSAILLLLLQH